MAKRKPVRRYKKGSQVSEAAAKSAIDAKNEAAAKAASDQSSGGSRSNPTKQGSTISSSAAARAIADKNSRDKPGSRVSNEDAQRAISAKITGGGGGGTRATVSSTSPGGRAVSRTRSRTPSAAPGGAAAGTPAEQAVVKSLMDRGGQGIAGIPAPTQGGGQLARDALLGKRDFSQTPMYDAAGNLVGQYGGERVSPGGTPSAMTFNPNTGYMVSAPQYYPGDLSMPGLPGQEPTFVASRFRPLLEPQVPGQAPMSAQYSPMGLPSPTAYDIGYAPPAGSIGPQPFVDSYPPLPVQPLSAAPALASTARLSGDPTFVDSGANTASPTPLAPQGVPGSPQGLPTPPPVPQSPSAQQTIPPMLETILPDSSGVLGVSAFPPGGVSADARTYGGFYGPDPMMTASPERLDTAAPDPFEAGFRSAQPGPVQGPMPMNATPRRDPFIDMLPSELLPPAAAPTPTPTPTPAPTPTTDLTAPRTTPPAGVTPQQIAADTAETAGFRTAAANVARVPGIGPTVAGVMDRVGSAFGDGDGPFGLPANEGYRREDGSFDFEAWAENNGGDEGSSARGSGGSEAQIPFPGKGGGGRGDRYRPPSQQPVNPPYIPPTGGGAPTAPPTTITPTPAYQSFGDLNAALSQGFAGMPGPYTVSGPTVFPDVPVPAPYVPPPPGSGSGQPAPPSSPSTGNSFLDRLFGLFRGTSGMAGGGMVQPGMTNAFTPGSYYASYDPRRRGLGGM